MPRSPYRRCDEENIDINREWMIVMMLVMMAMWSGRMNRLGTYWVTVGSRRADHWRSRRRRSTSNAAGAPDSVDVERADVSVTADRSRLNDPRGVRHLSQ
eukprot:711049-Pyramimonas_sp.AAC.1